MFSGIQRKRFFAVIRSNFISRTQAFFIRQEQHFRLVGRLEVNECFKKQKDPANNQTSTFTFVQGIKRVMSTSTINFGVKGKTISISAIYTTCWVLFQNFLRIRILFQATVIRELRGTAIEESFSNILKKFNVDIGVFQQKCTLITGNHDTTVAFIASKISREENVGWLEHGIRGG